MMKNDLISRSALTKLIKEFRNDAPEKTVRRYTCNAILSMIGDEGQTPAVDAVEVVRCRECKHWNEDALACDTLPWVNSSEHANWYAEDFCSYGERREDDGI